ncbi:MAG TPA: inosine/xanthosine triphosphatase [Methanobacterium sp.]|nr:MAG: inosine/xanthosine triphosphatase [Methanobacterium sp.]HOI70829.1 inosine/xanthosine triphosphatase [Methanobacterium sp.]
MMVQVGSLNPVKVQATRNVLEKFYTNITVSSVTVHSRVSDQPIGLDQTIEGAVNRAKEAYVPDFDLSVGIESGLIEAPHTITGYVDMQWCAIYDGEKITLGVSAGFEYPPSVVEEVLSGKEVGDVMDELTGVEDLGEKMGAVSYLSRGLLDRIGNTEQCVLMAMIPRLNEGIYFRD